MIYSVLSFTLIVDPCSVCLPPFVKFLVYSRGNLQGMGYPLSQSLVLYITLDFIVGVCVTFPYDLLWNLIVLVLVIFSSSALMVKRNKPATESMAT